MMKDLVENIKEISIDLQNLSDKIIQIYSKKEEKDKEINEGWYKFIQMVYKDSLNECFNNPQIYYFVHHVVSFLEKNRISSIYYKSNYEDALEIFNIFQFSDASFCSIRSNKMQNKSPKKVNKVKNRNWRYEQRVKSPAFNFSSNKIKEQYEHHISSDLTEMISASTTDSLTSSFFINNADVVIDRINKNYNILNNCLNYKHELFYENSFSSTLNIFNSKNSSNKIHNEELSRILRNNQKIIKSFHPKSNQYQQISQQQLHQRVYDRVMEHEKFMICIFCKNCYNTIYFLDFDAINKVNRQIASRMTPYHMESNMGKKELNINNIAKRERQMYSLCQNQISQNKIKLKEDSKFKFKHSKLFPKVNADMNVFENPTENEEQMKLIKWLQSCCEIKNKWNNLEIKLSEKHENLAHKKNGNKKLKKLKLNKDLKIVKDYRDSINDMPSLSTISASNISIKGIWKGLLDDQLISPQTIK